LKIDFNIFKFSYSELKSDCFSLLLEYIRKIMEKKEIKIFGALLDLKKENKEIESNNVSLGLMKLLNQTISPNMKNFSLSLLNRNFSQG
jgi:hypothetical protein